MCEGGGEWEWGETVAMWLLKGRMAESCTRVYAHVCTCVHIHVWAWLHMCWRGCACVHACALTCVGVGARSCTRVHARARSSVISVDVRGCGWELEMNGMSAQGICVAV